MGHVLGAEKEFVLIRGDDAAMDHTTDEQTWPFAPTRTSRSSEEGLLRRRRDHVDGAHDHVAR
jgi:hypothetical protein